MVTGERLGCQQPQLPYNREGKERIKEPRQERDQGRQHQALSLWRDHTTHLNGVWQDGAGFASLRKKQAEHQRLRRRVDG